MKGGAYQNLYIEGRKTNYFKSRLKRQKKKNIKLELSHRTQKSSIDDLAKNTPPLSLIFFLLSPSL
jgi:hypothetical protein